MIKGAVRLICLSAAVLLFSQVFFSCASEGGRAGNPGSMSQSPRNIPLKESFSSESGQLWTSVPLNGAPVFFGTASNRYHDDEEMRAALINAAEQASRYISIGGESGILDTREGHTGYTEVHFDHELAGRLIEDLEVVDTYRDYQGTYILAKLKGYQAPEVKYNPLPKGQRTGKHPPEWIRKIPEIPGYITGVGVVQRSYNLTDSLRRADDQAFVEIISQISIKVKGGQSSGSIESAGEGNKSVSSQIASAELKGFYVIARWHSIDGRYFYSLAVCPENNRK